MADTSGLPDLLVQSILQAFNVGKSQARPGEGSFDDILANDTAKLTERVRHATEEASDRTGSFSRSLPEGDGPFRPQPATPGRLDGFLAAQTPENARKADAMFGGDENMAQWTGRNTPKGFGAVLENLIAAPDDIMRNYRPGADNEPLNRDIGRRGFQAGPMTIGPAGAARAAGAGARAAELGAAGGKLPGLDDMPGIIVQMKQANPQEFTRLYTQAYNALTAEVPAMQGAAKTARDVGRPMSEGAVASEKLARVADKDPQLMGEIAERAAAFALWQKTHGGGGPELGAFGSRPQYSRDKPYVGTDTHAKLKEITDGLPADTPAKEIVRQYRAKYGDGGPADSTLVQQIGQFQRPGRDRMQSANFRKSPEVEEIIRNSLATRGPGSHTTVLREIQDALNLPRNSQVITTADVRRIMGELSGASGKASTSGGNPLKRKTPDRDLLASPQVEQLMLEADRRGEGVGMITNMVKRALGMRASDKSITVEHVTRQLGALRDRTRRQRGGGND